MLVRLKGDGDREVAVLVLPTLAAPAPTGFVQKNFEAVFACLGGGCAPGPQHCELSRELATFAEHPKVALTFLDAASDSFRSQKFVLSRLAQLSQGAPGEGRPPLLSFLPKIQGILADMRRLEQDRAGAEADAFARRKSALEAKVRGFLGELDRGQTGPGEGAAETDAALEKEFRQQLEGILEALAETEAAPLGQSPGKQSQSEAPAKESFEGSRSGRGKAETRKSGASLSVDGGEGRFFAEQPRRGAPFERDAAGGSPSEKTHRSTVEQKVGRPRSQRFTFQVQDSGGRLRKARAESGGEDFCRKFGEAQMDLFREKLERRKESARHEWRRRAWDAERAKGGLTRATRGEDCSAGAGRAAPGGGARAARAPGTRGGRARGDSAPERGGGG